MLLSFVSDRIHDLCAEFACLLRLLFEDFARLRLHEIAGFAQILVFGLSDRHGRRHGSTDSQAEYPQRKRLPAEGLGQIVAKIVVCISDHRGNGLLRT